MSLRDQIRKGSTELLILSLLAEKPMYGYQISQELGLRSNGYFELKEGLLYPTLHRMEKEGLLSSQWQAAGEARRRKYYTLTEQGSKVLGKQTAEWQNFIAVMQGMISEV